MAFFIVERSLPGVGEADLIRLGRVVTHACRRLRADRVTYIGTAHVDGEARCMCLFRAPDATAVRRVNQIAQVSFLRINEVMRTESRDEERAD